MKTTYSTDLLGNRQVEFITETGTRWQIVQIDSGVFFAVDSGTGWTPISTFTYADLWRSRTGDQRPWNAAFRPMVDQFIQDAQEDETA